MSIMMNRNVEQNIGLRPLLSLVKKELNQAQAKLTSATVMINAYQAGLTAAKAAAMAA